MHCPFRIDQALDNDRCVQLYQHSQLHHLGADVTSRGRVGRQRVGHQPRIAARLTERPGGVAAARLGRPGRRRLRSGGLVG